MTNKKQKSFYVTTTLPYVNSDPHIGFAVEVVRADVLARHHDLLGDDVFFNTGTDEHGQKIYDKATEAGETPQEYVDVFAAKFRGLKDKLNLWDQVNFIRTTDRHHIEAAQEFWRRCEKAGDIYKKQYQVKYCIGCELEKTDSELENGFCPYHPNKELELRDEENYFFRFSKYQDALLDLYNSRPDFVVPDYRLHEIKTFVENGLHDFSISRLASKMPWGIPVPGDDTQVMYVWFDALVNYVSAIGWPDDEEQFVRYHPVVQLAGKDNLRQQSAMWQAMLMSAGLEPSQKILVGGFITSGGQKMSKSVGNVINPYDLVDEYGIDATRYYLLRHIHPFEDSDFTNENFTTAYNASLANGIGNLTSRIMKMVVSYGVEYELSPEDGEYTEETNDGLDDFRFNEVMDSIWGDVAELDKTITETEPFKLIKTDEDKAKEIVAQMVVKLYHIAIRLQPLLPETAQTIREFVEEKETPGKPLFLRK